MIRGEETMKRWEIRTLADDFRKEVEQTAHQVSRQILAHLLHKMIEASRL
jgi:hypothetical protein